MKKALYFLLVLTNISTYAQLEINLNQDTLLQCQGYDTLLGTQLTILNAVEPIKYTWQSDILFSEEIYPASWALNDTTIATPTFTNLFASAIMTFHLTVEDALGNTDSDSTVIVTSQHIGNALNVTYYLAPGDSVPFSATAFLISNHPPDSYVWSPTDGLSDPYSPYPWASPDTITAYTLTLTDKWGCTSTYDPYIVYPLWLTSLTDQSATESDINLYPNPVSQGGIIQLLPEIQEAVSVSIYNVHGKLVQEETTTSGTIELDPSLEPGTYLCHVKIFDANNPNTIIVRRLSIQ